MSVAQVKQATRRRHAFLKSRICAHLLDPEPSNPAPTRDENRRSSFETNAIRELESGKRKRREYVDYGARQNMKTKHPLS